MQYAGNVHSSGNFNKNANKAPEKKFFKSKIDFMTPINNLKKELDPLTNNLSDDSYLDPYIN